ncbi:MAG TPA: AI-2E family transporter [Polyangiaceae bacterium]|jgi:predicted PurR-regulated permease PerM|nr:AI-2E family transporter [Polyangiaceae bacterium]
MTEIIIQRTRRPARVVFLAVWGLATLAVLLAAREILLPFILAIVVAYVLMPAVERVETWRVPRWSAVILVYVVTVGGMYASLAAMAPRLGLEMRGLLRELPAMAATIRDEHVPSMRRWLSNLTGVSPPSPAAEVPPSMSRSMRLVPRNDGTFELDLGPGIEVHQVGEGRWKIEEPPETEERSFEPGKFMSDAVSKTITYVQRNTMEVIRLGRSIVTAVSRAIFIFFMTLMLAAYMMITRERIMGFFRSLVFPDARRSFDLLLARMDRGLSGVVRGQMLICVVNGVLSAIGFWIFDLKYWPILAILAGVMSLVPIFGSILSSIPIVAIALTQSLGVAVEVLLWIVGIHQIEANLLNPKIIGDQAKIHPVLVVFSLLVGEHFFGLAGALLAVPVFSIAQSLFLHFRYITFGDDAPPDSFFPPAAHFATPRPPGVGERASSGGPAAERVSSSGPASPSGPVSSGGPASEGIG